MVTHKPMQQDLVTALKEINTASDLMEMVLSANQRQNETPNQELFEEVKHKIQTPNWQMVTENLIEGVIAGEPIKLEKRLEAELDLKTLFEHIDKMKSFDTSAIEQTIARLKSQPQGEELAQVLMTSVLPRSYGLFTDKQEVVEIIADQGLVHLNYVHILADTLPEPVTLNGELFQQKCWVNLEFFRGEEAFEKSFYYLDDSNGQTLSVTIQAAFSPL
jgi:hypothetical protein